MSKRLTTVAAVSTKVTPHAVRVTGDDTAYGHARVTALRAGRGVAKALVTSDRDAEDRAAFLAVCRAILRTPAQDGPGAARAGMRAGTTAHVVAERRFATTGSTPAALTMALKDIARSARGIGASDADPYDTTLRAVNLPGGMIAVYHGRK